MPQELSKAYDPAQVEARWAEYWVREKLFHVETPQSGDSARPIFTIAIPPPNVTGYLHMGHMLEHTEIDIIVRWQRMRGYQALWLPGTDHAGIATQLMVERQLAADGKKRRDLGREEFIARVWKWRAEYGGAILGQMKRLGESVDWDREYFTMDDARSRAVREAFVRLHEEGLIYRGNYIVNWCPRCGTAISDLEVIHEDTPGKLFEIRYPVVDSGEFIAVATTRPETMLGDTAVAVNARDPRYTHLHGKKVRLPLMEREIPIILDDLAKPEFGTGAVKITPAHDPNDFQAGLRHNLPQITVMDEHARMNDHAGRYAGLDRYEARERVLHDLQEQGFLVGSKDYVVPLGKCDRCKTIVEPRLSLQWFVAVKQKPNGGGPSLAEKATAVVLNGEITFVPENYRQIYLNWMENIYDWCISRQLWWGHRIPAWHCKENASACKEIVVAREAPANCPKCGSVKLEQDPDVLDTWFSSGLLPMSALGWPEKTRDLEVFYPSSLLITGFDILFFWVARMIMLNCHFMAEHHQEGGVKQVSGDAARKDDSVPFRHVYIHALVRDADRQKMSKTKGNVLDPIKVIEKYGTDATRFTMAAMASPGTDIAFNESRTEGYRAFANKIWNAARFIFMNVERLDQAGIWSLARFRPMAINCLENEKRRRPAVSSLGTRGWAGVDLATTPEATGRIDRSDPLPDRWIFSRLERIELQVHVALGDFRFDDAANAIYQFFWGEFCDWYLELVKPRLLASDAREAALAAARLVTIFERALRLLSPIMPFITEELWQAVFEGQPPFASIALAPYPAGTQVLIDWDAETEMAVLQDLIVTLRNLRAELKIEPKLCVPARVFAFPETTGATAVNRRSGGFRVVFENNREAVERLANAKLAILDEPLERSANLRITSRFQVEVVFEHQIDVATEQARLLKEKARFEGELTNAERQLANEQFLAKAPPSVVEGIRNRRQELEALLEKNRSALEGLEQH